jgi:hypothetical protein
MADIGRILFLPPATISGRASSIQAGSIQAGNDQPGMAPADSAPPVDDAATGRAKQFRFRVYDGRRPDEALAGDNGVPARRAREDDAPAEQTARSAARPGTDPRGDARQRGTGAITATAPFLAQLIAQEQLRPGLYDPPLRAADLAYRQAGGEPALTDRPSTARFQIAV